MIDIFNPSPWQMTFGERAALTGILSQLRPQLAIEIGTAEGGSLRCVAQHSEHVHSFDLVAPDAGIAELQNVTLHTGDGHVLLAELLGELAREGRNVDFVLVDGDHTPDGVECDVRDLLASDAISSTVILLHDTLNDDVRAGLTRIDYDAEPKVAHVELDFVGGHLSDGGPFHHQLWGGLGLIVVDAERRHEPEDQDGARFYDLFDLVASARQTLIGREQGTTTTAGTAAGDQAAEADRLRAELAGTRQTLASIESSASWRLTAPLRVAKRRLLGRR
jgi:hypothetical protein